jgi:hypothetical protein
MPGQNQLVNAPSAWHRNWPKSVHRNVLSDADTGSSVDRVTHAGPQLVEV